MQGSSHGYIYDTHRGMDLIPPCLNYYLILYHCRPMCKSSLGRSISSLTDGVSVVCGYVQWYGHVLPRTTLINIMCVH